MKTKIVFILIAVLVCSALFNACDFKKANDKTVLKQPPVLFVTNGDNTIEAKMGSNCWSFDAENGVRQGICSDYAKTVIDDMPKLEAEILPHSVLPFSSVPAHLITLKSSPMPDEVEIRRLTVDNYNNNSEVFEAVSVKDFSFEIKEGNYVYEVFARWNGTEGYEGDCVYCFFVQTSVLIV